MWSRVLDFWLSLVSSTVCPVSGFPRPETLWCFSTNGKCNKTSYTEAVKNEVVLSRLKTGNALSFSASPDTVVIAYILRQNPCLRKKWKIYRLKRVSQSWIDSLSWVHSCAWHVRVQIAREYRDLLRVHRSYRTSYEWTASYERTIPVEWVL